MTNKIIFLDQDGPTIPGSMFVFHSNPSFKRIFSPVCIGIVKKLCELSGAKIVCNSSHNTHLNFFSDEPTSLKDDLMSAGIPQDMFHHEWRTKFPVICNRMIAIQDWLENNDLHADWIAFDDEKFTDNERLIHVDFSSGITIDHFNKACKFWGIASKFIF